ncbi:hypothetical protein BKN14_03895 [Candidatus Gracilibacteria bacterium HOT-871]|nr:hypothetical protein BKN14_03895 [Candidatus Gracilibacteria bacterium HOT-871]
MTLTVLDALFIVLIVFTSVIGTLIILILMRIFKILGPFTDLVDYYEKIKKMTIAYFVAINALRKNKNESKEKKSEK